MTDVEEFLAHYGVLGMKWGVRKDRGSGARSALGAARSSSGKALDDQNTKGATWNKKASLAKKNLTVDQLMTSVVKPINPDYPKGRGSKMNCRRASLSYELRRRGYDVKATTKNAPKGQDLSGTLNMLDRGQGDQLYKPGIFGAISNLRSDKKQLKANPKAETAFKDKIDEFKVKQNQSLVISKTEIKAKPNEKMTDAIFSNLKKLPDRSRGELNVHFGPMLIGHSLAFEIVNKKPVIFDAQRGKVYKSGSDIAADKKLPLLVTSAFTRLDNAPLNTEFLKGWAENA